MNKEFILYTEALALKELGFDEPCFGFFQVEYAEVIPTMVDDDEQYRLTGYRTCKNSEMPEHYTSAPTYSQAFRFFREKYNWQSSIDATQDQQSSTLGYNYWIWNNKTGEEHFTMPKNSAVGDWEYETYELAELACLKKLIELVKNK